MVYTKKKRGGDTSNEKEIIQKHFDNIGAQSNDDMKFVLNYIINNNGLFPTQEELKLSPKTMSTINSEAQEEVKLSPKHVEKTETINPKPVEPNETLSTINDNKVFPQAQDALADSKNSQQVLSRVASLHPATKNVANFLTDSDKREDVVNAAKKFATSKNGKRAVSLLNRAASVHPATKFAAIAANAANKLAKSEKAKKLLSTVVSLNS